MRTAQRLWRRLVQLPYWTFRCMWLQVNGRLYYMRNAPTWFVRFFAQWPLGDGEALRFVADAWRTFNQEKRK